MIFFFFYMIIFIQTNEEWIYVGKQLIIKFLLYIWNVKSGTFIFDNSSSLIYDAFNLFRDLSSKLIYIIYHYICYYKNFENKDLWYLLVKIGIIYYFQ